MEWSDKRKERAPSMLKWKKKNMFKILIGKSRGKAEREMR